MERSKSSMALALLSVLFIFVTASAVFGKVPTRALFSSSTAGNKFVQLGKPASPILTSPDILMPDKGNSIPATPDAATLLGNAPVDFNGDGKTDFVVVRNTGGGPNGQLTWYYAQNGGSGNFAANWGLNSDWVLSQDFDGDGKDDITIWRPGTGGTAAFYILNSGSNTFRVDQFGQTGDIPTVSQDYDGDGKADVAVYRPGAQSYWFYRSSLTGNFGAIPWGTTGDIPYPGDFDGDLKSDFGIARPDSSNHLQFWRRTSTGTVMPVVAFGTAADFTTPGDYDGDGKTDIASVNASGGQMRWQFMASSNGGVNTTFWGAGNDYPVQGDYDADGKTDIAIYRRGVNPGDPAFWVLLSSNGSLAVRQWGLPGDFPVAAFNVF